MSEEQSLEQRKNGLFATITLLAGVKRDIASAQAAGRDVAELYDRQAQLEADKERLSHEVNSEYMYRNLQAFMNRVDAYDAERKTEAERTHSGLAALSGQFQELADDVTQLKKDMQASRSDRQSLHETDGTILREIAGVKADVEALKQQLVQYMAGSRRAEVDTLRQEIERLKQEHGDDGD
jgi:outer membrane murein-binding lipoprotein Lpp